VLGWLAGETIDAIFASTRRLLSAERATGTRHYEADGRSRYCGIDEDAVRRIGFKRRQPSVVAVPRLVGRK
jgi:hypothetical protein